MGKPEEPPADPVQELVDAVVRFAITDHVQAVVGEHLLIDVRTPGGYVLLTTTVHKLRVLRAIQDAGGPGPRSGRRVPP